MPDLRDRLATVLAPRYLVERQLAAGGMGTVFLGHDPTLGREVAIKVLPPENATAVAVERFLRETRLLAQLSHPHIVPILEAQHRGQLLWFVMPRIHGGTLAQRIEAGPLPPGEVARMGVQLLQALEHAHANGVIHRDIKPSNIFVVGDQSLLADFGVASLESSHSDTLTGSDQVVGTLRYMAPEQASAGSVTERSDIYALGATLYEAATGRRWDQAEATSSRAWRGLPWWLRRPLRGALHADPARRWPSAVAFRRALREGASRTIVRTLVVGIVAVSLLATAMIARRSVIAAPVARQRAALVVMPFGKGASALGTDLARYTSLPIEFSRVPALPFVNVNQMSLDSARRIADRVVTGELKLHGGKGDSLAVMVYGSGGEVLDLLMIPGDSANAGGWGLAVADSLVRRLFPAQLAELRQLGGTHPNREALDAYAEGQQLFQQGRWHDAEERFAKAERIDSSLVPATWHKLIARQWQALPFKDELARLALRVGTRPGPLAGLLAAELEPDLETRLVRYDSLAHEYPDAPMVRQLQANELFSRGPLIGHPLKEGIEAFRRTAIEIPELDQPNTYTQTIWGAVRIGDERLAREQLGRRRAAAGDPWASMLWLAVNGRFRRWLAVPVREFMLRTSDSTRRATLARAVRMGLDLDDPFDQLAVGSYLEAHAATDMQRANALAAESTALLLLGRPLEALAHLDRGAQSAGLDEGFRLQRWEWRVLLPLLPGAAMPLPDSTRERGRAGLRSVPADSRFWPRAAWALTVDAIARNDAAARDSLLALLRLRSAAPWIGDLTAFATAIALGAEGNNDSALALTRRIRRDLPDSEIGLRGPLVRAMTYLHRGEWQLAMHNAAGAESEWLWHENNDIPARPQGEPHQGELDAALSGLARLQRAEVLSQLDRRSDACALLDRVLVLWKNAEPSMQPLQLRATSARHSCRK